MLQWKVSLRQQACQGNLPPHTHLPQGWGDLCGSSLSCSFRVSSLPASGFLFLGPRWPLKTKCWAQPGHWLVHLLSALWAAGKWTSEADCPEQLPSREIFSFLGSSVFWQQVQLNVLWFHFSVSLNRSPKSQCRGACERGRKERAGEQRNTWTLELKGSAQLLWVMAGIVGDQPEGNWEVDISGEGWR